MLTGTMLYNTIQQYNTIQYNFIICKQKFDFTSQGIDIYTRGQRPNESQKAVIIDMM